MSTELPEFPAYLARSGLRRKCYQCASRWDVEATKAMKQSSTGPFATGELRRSQAYLLAQGSCNSEVLDKVLVHKFQLLAMVSNHGAHTQLARVAYGASTALLPAIVILSLHPHVQLLRQTNLSDSQDMNRQNCKRPAAMPPTLTGSSRICPSSTCAHVATQTDLPDQHWPAAHQVLHPVRNISLTCTLLYNISLFIIINCWPVGCTPSYPLHKQDFLVLECMLTNTRWDVQISESSLSLHMQSSKAMLKAAEGIPAACLVEPYYLMQHLAGT